MPEFLEDEGSGARSYTSPGSSSADLKETPITINDSQVWEGIEENTIVAITWTDAMQIEHSSDKETLSTPLPICTTYGRCIGLNTEEEFLVICYNDQNVDGNSDYMKIPVYMIQEVKQF